MPEATKERPKTDNSSLKAALTIQTGEKAARVEVKRDEKPLSYRELEGMTLSDLLQCKLSVLGFEAGFQKQASVFRGSPDLYHYWWKAFGFIEVRTSHMLQTPAVDVLEKAYQLAICAAGGGI